MKEGFGEKQIQNKENNTVIKDKRFQKRVENFTCEHCGKMIEGTGYTDHYSECLWSKHMDINPGDRKSECGGALEPVGIEVKGSSYFIHYKCEQCGFAHRVKADKKDDMDAIIALSRKPFNAQGRF